MNICSPSSPAQSAGKRLRFEEYTLDLDRGCLLLRDQEICLRPKTFSVLTYLVDRPHRLISKDELFSAVWPNLAITDDVLVQSIGELRRALGDDGPRLIKTVPRRGYRFDCEVDANPPTAAPETKRTDEAETVAALQSSTPDARAIGSTLLNRTLRSRGSGLVAATILAVLIASIWLVGSGSGSKNPTPRATAARSVEAGSKPIIAILPFTGERDHPDAYFANGLTQDVINLLGRFSALTVMSWNAVSAYKNTTASPGEIAGMLGARYQVEGNVHQIEGRVRVNAQLVDGDGRVLWSGRFDEAPADIYVLQDKLTAQIVQTLAIRVTQLEQQRASAKPVANLEAYDHVLRSRPALQRPTRAANVEARALLRQAIQLDPNYAAAYAGLGETYYIAVSMGWAQSPADFLARAEEMAAKAVSLDHANVRARVLLGRIHIFHQRYEQAQAEINRALELNPNDADGLAGRGNILMWLGQTDAAIEALETAQRINPELSTVDRFALSLAYYLEQRYEAAAQQAELNIRRGGGAQFNQPVLAAAYAQQSREEEASRVAAFIRQDPTFDPQAFGSKFLNPGDLERLRDGFRKAGL